jgi:hypothetical protein
VEGRSGEFVAKERRMVKGTAAVGAREDPLTECKGNGADFFLNHSLSARDLFEQTRPVVVQLARAYCVITDEPPACASGCEIVSLGDRQYRLGSGQPITVSGPEDDVLQAVAVGTFRLRVYSICPPPPLRGRGACRTESQSMLISRF